MPEVQSDPTYIDVNELSIESYRTGKKFEDLTGQMQTIEIYESINSHTITVDIAINDGLDIYSALPITGEEKIILEIATPGGDDSEPIRYELYVNKILGMTMADDGSSRSYVIRCCTKEFLTNKVSQYTRKYSDQPGKVIESILTDKLKSDKELVISEPTKGTFDYMVYDKRPLQIIDLITERSVSLNHKSSLFVFYEDIKGYNFTTIENLIAIRKEYIGDKQFFFDTNTAANIKNKNMRNIIAMTIMNTGDNINKLMSGALKSKTEALDLITGKVEVSTYQDSVNSDDFVKIDDSYENFNSSEYLEEFEVNSGKSFFVLKDISRPENYHDISIGHKIAYGSKLTQFNSLIKIAGDTEILPGDVIEINVPVFSSLTLEEQNMGVKTKSTGNYLITDLKRKIFKKSDQFSHEMSCSLVKGSFADSDDLKLAG